MAYTNIDDPSAHFQTATYAGNGSTQSITNDGNSDLQPDLVWTKSRSDSSFHAFTDSTRGTNLRIYPNSNAAEESHTDRVTAFNSDGFSLGSSSLVNTNGYNYAAWQWKANGGTTSTDTTSSITSTVQVNSDAGFSIVTYTGNGNTLGGFGHGLGVAPKVVFVKRRDAAADWCVYHKDMGAAYFMKLNTTDAQQSGPWQDLDPSSTTVVVYSGALVNGNGDTYVAYCFAEKQGYSKFGKYVGNGSNTNGSFIYTGFRPAMIIAKRTDASAHNWFIWDTKRAPSNLVQAVLYPNATSAEGSLFQIDILSNGFKHYNNYGSTNVSGGTYIYMAFAENPFTTSTGIPTTAR